MSYGQEDHLQWDISKIMEVNATLKQMLIAWENFETKLMKKYSLDVQQKEGITNFITID